MKRPPVKLSSTCTTEGWFHSAWNLWYRLLFEDRFEGPRTDCPKRIAFLEGLLDEHADEWQRKTFGEDKQIGLDL